MIITIKAKRLTQRASSNEPIKMDRLKPRPVYLNLLQIRLPIGGLVSIFHRITGVFLVLALPVTLYLLDLSLDNHANFLKAKDLLFSIPGKIALVILGAIFLQHLFSGIRHLFLDIDIGVGKHIAGKSAWATLLLTLVFIIMGGLILW